MFNDPNGPFQKLADKVTLAFVAHTRKLAIIKLCVIFIVLAHIQSCLLGLSALFAEQRAVRITHTHRTGLKPWINPALALLLL